MSIDASANIYFDCIREDFIKNFQEKSGIFTNWGEGHFPDLFKTAQKKMFHMLPKA